MKLAFVCSGVLMCLGFATSARAQLLNGEMASPFVPIVDDAAGGSVPSGWWAQGIANANFLREQSSQNSPFSTVFANNGSSVHISDHAAGATGVEGYGFLQTFSTGYTGGAAGFDFMMENMPASGVVGVQFNNTGNVSGGTPVTRVRFELNNNGVLAFTTATNVSVPILSIASGVWYHVAFNWDGSGLFTGTATPFGGSASNFTGTLTTNGANNISGVQVRDRDENPAGDIYLDNIYVVPEPSVVTLVSLGGLLLLLSLRKHRVSLRLSAAA